MTTVFLSYSHDTGAHCEKILTLANKLRESGVDVSVDAYEPHPKQGWPKWMEKQFSSDFIIVAMSPDYVRDFDQDIDNASGGRYEASLLSSKLLKQGMSFGDIAVVCFEEFRSLRLPGALFGCTRYFVDDEDEYSKLYAFLTGQKLVEKPPLGEVTTMIPRSANPTVSSFPDLCKGIWPLMEDSRRIFEDFGPNSGAGEMNDPTKVVRQDLSLWYERRGQIVANNETICRQITRYADKIPIVYRALFEQWVSHIEAFRSHVGGDNIDYRQHQFPKEIVRVVKDQLQ